MKATCLLTNVLTTVALVLIPALSSAQNEAPAAPAQPAAEEQAVLTDPNLTEIQRQQMAGYLRQIREVSLEQRKQMIGQMFQLRDIQMRLSLTYAGVTDPGKQEAILAYLKEGDIARLALHRQWNGIEQALHAKVSDSNIALLLNNFRGAIEDERARRATARTALDAKIGLDKDPRLEARLITSQILGEEGAFININGGEDEMMDLMQETGGH